MNFDSLIDNLKIRLMAELPGSASHELLRAKPIGQLLPKFDHKLPPKLGSVLILLYKENGVIKFPLIKRQTYTGAHSAQVSLPGGKVEPDEDVFQAALREAEEEIGVNRNDIRVIGRLSDFNVLPSNFLVTPVVASIDYIPKFIPDAHEVAKIIQADLSELINDSAIKESEILAAGLYRMIAPHFFIDEEIVWGATAMMLNEFRAIIKELEMDG
jgi:8-oxo-dGTP pyrophosphatase MutT (NUDIX family)